MKLNEVFFSQQSKQQQVAQLLYVASLIMTDPTTYLHPNVVEEWHGNLDVYLGGQKDKEKDTDV